MSTQEYKPPIPPGTALLVIDVQQGLFNRPIPIYQAKALLENIHTLIHRAQAAGAPVIFVQHTNEGFLAQGTQNWELHPVLNPEDAGCTIHKRHGNAFVDTSLKAELDSRRVRSLVITGLVSHGCVQATCLGAIQLGYQAILAKDAHSNYNRKAPEVIQETNQKMESAGVTLRATQEIDFDS